MKVISIRRITNDSNHNAFTGACWFKNALYVAFRQGDAHVCKQGRLVVMRSRDDGISFDTVAVLRGEYDTRDAHLYNQDNKRLFLAGFEHTGDKDCYAGTAWTDDGIHWSPWTRLQTDIPNAIFWRPRFFRGKFYCAAYHDFEKGGKSAVSWCESGDGIKWKKMFVLHEGKDQPNECCFDFKPTGEIAMIMRREHESKKPLLLTSAPPYVKWTKTELDIPLAGPALWLAGEDIWISGRWFLNQETTHVGIFKIESNKPLLKMVLPSGPGFDCSYMGVAQRPDNRHRFNLSYYSGHTAPDDPDVDQWSHPDIYLADVLFDAPFIENWKVSDVMDESLASAVLPDTSSSKYRWKDMKCNPSTSAEPNFVDAHQMIKGRKGVVYFVSDLEIGPHDRGNILLGFDGPVKAWLNNLQIFEGDGTNPAYPDKISIPVTFKHGTNRLVIALDTNNGKAWGIFARYETTF